MAQVMSRELVRRVAPRLRELLSSEELVRLATELLGEKARDAAAGLFEILKQDPGENVVTNIMALMAHLARNDSKWALLLDKSVEKRGRCPRPLVPRLRAMLANQPGAKAIQVGSVREMLADLETVVEEATTQDVIVDVKITTTTRRFRSGRTRVEIPISNELTDIRHMESLAGALGRIPAGADEVCFDFRQAEHVYVAGLAAIVAWCRGNDVVPEIANCADHLLRYLQQIGFIKVLTGGTSPYREEDPAFAMAIEPIDQTVSPETIAARLVATIDHHAPLSKSARQGLLVLFAELIENVHRHAGWPCPCFACAQVYPKRHKLNLCVVDRGIGIHRSIATSSNERLKSRVREGESAVRLACAPLVTSKPDKHSGYGLYVASELVVRNGGTFRLFSDGEILTRYRKQWQKREYVGTASSPWNGTWIAMLLDLESSIEVGDVYLTLPPAPGAELEDYF